MDHWTENYCGEENNFFQKITVLFLYSHFLKKSVRFMNLGFNISIKLFTYYFNN